MPDDTYAVAYTAVIQSDNNFCTPSNTARSSRLLLSYSIIRAPTSSYKINEAVTIGEMPSSMSVPLLLANTTRIQ